MKILVDTCIWSTVLRHKNKIDNHYASVLKDLILEGRANLIGPIRQELLSGLSSKQQFKKLKKALAPFPNLVISSEEYSRAAEMYNIIRSNGIQGSPVDLLICAVAEKFNMKIFTVDKDFKYFSNHLPIRLYEFSH